MNIFYMKGTIRLPTKTQFAFIEAEVEGSPQEIVEAYNELNQAYWGQGGGEGLPKKEFDELLDDYCWNDGAMASEHYEKMSAEQQNIIQAIKRSKKREIYKARKVDIEKAENIKNITDI